VTEHRAKGSLKEKMGKEIRIVREPGSKRAEEYTFIDNVLDLTKIPSENESNLLSQFTDKKKKDDVFKLRNTPKKDMKSRKRSGRSVGGRSTHSHSPVYE
jgi:hypothetical protein